VHARGVDSRSVSGALCYALTYPRQPAEKGDFRPGMSCQFGVMFTEPA
jgi:hypothetical protein